MRKERTAGRLRSRADADGPGLHVRGTWWEPGAEGGGQGGGRRISGAVVPAIAVLARRVTGEWPVISSWALVSRELIHPAVPARRSASIGTRTSGTTSWFVRRRASKWVV